MPSLCLPSKPDLDHLKGQARTLQRQVRAGEAEALGIVREFHPRPDAVPDQSAFRLSDAQLVLARRYGFPSWAALRRHLAVVAEFGRSPHLVPVGDDDGPEDRADRMLRLGCLVYGGDDLDRHARAGAILAASRELADKDIWTAAAAGNFAHVRRLLGADPSLVDRPGGPFDWVPLLYVTYSRIHDAPQFSPIRTAAILLEAGADPNAGYLWDGTYLDVNVLGRTTPLHQAAYNGDVAVVRTLLELGADPDRKDRSFTSPPLAWAEHTRQDAVIELLRGVTTPRRPDGTWPERAPS
ncbi:MAG: ankyrin repeat domain-containing protein [Acidimicrobiales bacterium]